MLVLIIVAVVIIALFLNKEEKPILDRPDPCGLHKWERRGEEGYEYLICRVCSRLPGGEGLE